MKTSVLKSSLVSALDVFTLLRVILKGDKRPLKSKCFLFFVSTDCLLTSQVLLAGHVVPNAVHLLRGDLVHSDNPSVSAQTVGHFPVIKTTVLIGVNTKLKQAKSHIHILQVQQSCV